MTRLRFKWLRRRLPSPELTSRQVENLSHPRTGHVVCAPRDAPSTNRASTASTASPTTTNR